jgi:hypothetical protein
MVGERRGAQVCRAADARSPRGQTAPSPLGSVEMPDIPNRLTRAVHVPAIVSNRLTGPTGRDFVRATIDRPVGRSVRRFVMSRRAPSPPVRRFTMSRRARVAPVRRFVMSRRAPPAPVRRFTTCRSRRHRRRDHQRETIHDDVETTDPRGTPRFDGWRADWRLSSRPIDGRKPVRPLAAPLTRWPR